MMLGSPRDHQRARPCHLAWTIPLNKNILVPILVGALLDGGETEIPRARGGAGIPGGRGRRSVSLFLLRGFFLVFGGRLAASAGDVSERRRHIGTGGRAPAGIDVDLVRGGVAVVSCREDN